MPSEPVGCDDFGTVFRGHGEDLNIGGGEGAREIFEGEAIIWLTGSWRGGCGIEREAEAAVLPVGE